MEAQLTIKGQYNSLTKTYEANDSSYWIDIFKDEFALFSKHGYLGLVKSNGEIIVKPVYDNIIDFDGKIVRFILNGKYGSQEVAKIKLFPEDYYIQEFHDGIAKFSEYSDKNEHFSNNYHLSGFINENGKIISPIGTAGSFSNFIGGIATSSINDSITLMNKLGHTKSFKSSRMMLNESLMLQRTQGIVIIPIVENQIQKYYYVNERFEKLANLHFDWASNFVDNYAVVNYGNRWFIIDVKGNLIETNYKSIFPVQNGTFIATDFKNRTGVIDHNGIVKIPFDFAQIKYLFQDLYAVSKSQATNTPFTSGGYNVININNEVILLNPAQNSNSPLNLNYFTIEKVFDFGIGKAFEIDQIISKDQDKQHTLNRLPEYTYNGKIYFFDKHGLISDKGFPNSNAVAIQAMAKDYLITNFNFYDFEESTNYTEQYKPLLILKNAKFYIIEFDEYYSYNPLGNEKLIVSNKNERGEIKFGLVNTEKETIIPFIYDELKSCVHNVLVAKLDDKWGLIDFENNVISEFEYDYAESTPSGIIVSKKDKFGLVDFKGIVILPLKFINLSSYKGSLYALENGNTTFISKSLKN